MRITNMKTFIISLCFAAITCTPNPVETVPVNQEFDIAVGQSVVVGGQSLIITFVRLDEDSRCPQGVLCLWAGNARATFRMEKPGVTTAEADLNTTLDPRSTFFAGYGIVLKQLTPYPQLDVKVDLGSYVARLLVTK